MSEREVLIAIGERLERIASALEQLAINQKAKMISEALQQEDKKFNKETLNENEKLIQHMESVEEKQIEWIIHDNKKYKPCKYGCGLIVSYDKEKKDYVHFNKDFVYVMDKCPKYAGGA